jgi:hypothetical protein
MILIVGLPARLTPFGRARRTAKAGWSAFKNPVCNRQAANKIHFHSFVSGLL